MKKNSLEIENLNIETTDGTKVVKGLNLTLNSGEVHVLTGPNGAGKSSFLNAFFNYPKFKITSGKILLNDKDITNISTDKKAKLGLFLSMQYLPKIEGVTISSFLYKAYKNLKDENISILDFYGSLKKIANHLNIPEDFLSRYLNVDFSGGEKKQSEALQLAVLKPHFAFLDEIDSGVDVDSLKKVIKAIEVAQESGTGFLLVTHYDKLLEKIKPDFVHIMDKGKIIKSGGSSLMAEIQKDGFKL